MTTSNTDWTMDGMDNPLVVQEKLLDRFEAETDTVIVDTNNPASVTMEGFANVTSGLIRKIEDVVRPAIYPARANTAEDLYKHLSDYDYIDVFAHPSQATIQLVVDRVYIMDNSVEVEGAEYKKLIIPASTRFTIGTHYFGIYYPIEIRSNKDTGRFSVVYDTSVVNPLYSVSTNSLEYDVRKYSGHDLVFIKIPVFQFEVNVQEDVLIEGTGYKRSIAYSNKFYAIRATCPVLTNPDHDETEEDVFEDQELSLRVSGQTYDPDTPTLVFTPDLVNNALVVEIPYVYFTKNLVHGTLRLEIYTTEGAIDYTIPLDTEEVCTIDMFTQLTDETVATYADPFKKMPALQIMPLSTTIVGGDDGMDADTLKRRVVNGTLKSKTLQTPDDIDAYFEDNNYITTKLRDGVTDRIFIAHAAIKNTSGEVIGADSIGTLFDFREETLKQYDTIVTSGSSTFTVLPSTIYKMDRNKGICTPLTQLERVRLLNLTPAELIAEFNDNVYTLSPFHLQVDIASKYPTTITYDMTDVGIQTQQFIGDREEPSVQLILNASELTTVKDDVKNFYRFTFRVSRSGQDDIQAVVNDGDAAGQKNFRVIVGLKNDDGAYYYGEASWDGWTGEYDIFHIDIKTDYKFHQSNNEHTVVLKVPMVDADTDPTKYQETDFFLTSEVRVFLCEHGDLYSISSLLRERHCIDIDLSNVSTDVIEDFSDYYVMSEHKLMCKYGAVVNELDQRINLAYSQMTYKRYNTTKFLTLDTAIYARNSDGTLKIEDGVYRYYLTEDTTYDKKKVYYERYGTGTKTDPYTYVQVPVPSEPISPVSEGYYEYTHKLSVTELYPEGTLTCVTKHATESMILNDSTVGNYIEWGNVPGCTYVYQDDAGETKTGTITEAFPTEHPGQEISVVDAPVVPRFFVKSTGVGADGDFSVTGSYELYDARDAGPSSSSSDIWVMTGDTSKYILSDVYPEDALYYVMENVIGTYSGYKASTDTTVDTTKTYYTYVADERLMQKVVSPTGDPSARGYYEKLDGPKADGVDIVAFDRRDAHIVYAAGSETPLKNVLGLNGTFMMVADDGSEFDNTVPVISELTAAQKEGGTPRAVLYFCTSCTSANGVPTSSTWAAVAQGRSVGLFAKEVWDRSMVSECVKSWGYVYNLWSIYRAKETSPFKEQRFVAFLNTKTVNGVQVPDFTQFVLNKWSEPDTNVPASERASGAGDRVYMNCQYDSDGVLISATEMNHNEGIPGADFVPLLPGDNPHDYVKSSDYKVGRITLIHPEFGWITNVNRWPWDAKIWMYLDTSSSIVKNGTSTVGVRFAEDADFVIAFDSTRLLRYCAYSSGELELLNGEPQEDPNGVRTIQYLIDMLQLDAKHGQTTINKNTEVFPANVTNVMRDHFTFLGNAKNNLFTNTRLFFASRKSLGNCEYGIGDGRTEFSMLDVSVGFKLYVSQSVADDSTLQDNIYNTIVDIIDTKIETAKELNCVEVAKEILSQLSDNIKRVDILGINGDSSLQTIKCIDTEAVPHLGHELYLLTDDRTIDIRRKLNLVFSVVDD